MTKLEFLSGWKRNAAGNLWFDCTSVMGVMKCENCPLYHVTKIACYNRATWAEVRMLADKLFGGAI